MELLQTKFFQELTNQYSVTVSDGGFSTVDSRWNRDYVCSPFSRIYYVAKGGAALIINGQKFFLSPGYVYLIPLGTPYQSQCLTELCHLYFHINIITPNGYDLLHGIHTCAKIRIPPEKIERLIQLYLSQNFLSAIELQAELYHSVALLLRELNIQSFGNEQYSEEIMKVIDYIREHLSARLSLSEIAKALYISPNTLSKRFKKETGISIGKYIDRMLFFNAERLLSKSEATIKEISNSLGFCDQFYFSRRFSRHFGESPKSYRIRTQSTDMY